MNATIEGIKTDFSQAKKKLNKEKLTNVATKVRGGLSKGLFALGKAIQPGKG